MYGIGEAKHLEFRVLINTQQY